MNNCKKTKNTLAIYYASWAVIATFYFYQYILRICPGIMVVELRQIFKLTAQEFSSLGAIYLFSYSLLQIPLGFILDWIGVKRVMIFSVLVCIAGTCLFAFAIDVWMLQLGRFLIGLGSAPAFICALKLVYDHLPSKYCGLLMGITLSLGTLGALLSGKFLVRLLDNQGWQITLYLCAGLGAFILALVLATIPSNLKTATAAVKASTHFRQGLREIFNRKEILIYAVIAICVYTPLCVLADLWGAAFLMEKFAIPRATAVQLSLYLYGGLTFGSLLLPWLSVKCGKLKEFIQICTLGLILALFTLFYIDNLELWQVACLLSLIGVFCGAEMICFTGAVQYSPDSHSGLTLGVVNTLNMLGGALIQQMIGWYLDFHWKGEYTLEGARFYGVAELTSAFSWLIVIIFACCLLSFKLSKKGPFQSQSLDQAAQVAE